MTVYAKALCLSAEVHRIIHIPKHIKINPLEEGDTWWIKWTTLYYNNGDDEYDFGFGEYDGDYKRPKITTDDDDLYEEGSESECESECECAGHISERVCPDEVEPDESVCYGIVEAIRNGVAVDTTEVIGNDWGKAQSEEYEIRLGEVARGK